MIYSETKASLIIEGLIFVALGLVALYLPVVSTISITLMIAVLCIVTGIAQYVTAYRGDRQPSFWLAILNALLVIIVGVLLLVYPISAMFVLTAVLGIWFLVNGITQMIYAIQLRDSYDSWGVMLLSGLISVILAIIIGYGWPHNSLWLLGVLLGINLLLFGISLLALGFRTRSA